MFFSIFDFIVKYINQHLIPLNEVRIEDIPDSDDPNASNQNSIFILKQIIINIFKN